MTPDPLITAFPADCAALRDDLIARQLPPVWSLDAQTARRLHREGAELVRAAWQPPLDSLPVTYRDVPVEDALPPTRVYQRHDAASRELGEAPTLVWFHGGGWVLGDLETGHAAAMTACALTGWDVINVDYRCAPVHPFPAAFDDCVAATARALLRGRRVVVAGDSAGGNLAGLVARELASESGLIGQVLIYPATDPTLSFPSAMQFTDGPFLTRRDMEWFYDEYLTNDGERTDTRVDLMSGGVGPAPAIVFTVGHDPLRDEGIAYASRLAEHGVAVTQIHAPELFHGCVTQSGVLPSSAARVQEVWAAAQQMFT